MDEEDDIMDAFDPRAGDWPQPVKEGLAALANACLSMNKKKRIGVLDALRQLRALEATHCQITPAEGQLVLLRIKMAELLTQADLAEHRLVSQLRTCCVCFDDVQSATGLQCPGLLHAKDDDHFVCGSCADRYVREETANNKEHVGCIKAECMERYSDTALARVLPGECFVKYLGATEGIRVRKAVGEDRTAQAAAAAAQAARPEEDREAMVRKEHVITHILDQSCPSCHYGFDFTGDCFALVCQNKNCKAAFCGYCFHVSPGGDAHGHTAGCDYNAFGLFGLGEELNQNNNERIQIRNFGRAQNRRRVRGLRLYLATLQPAQRERLLLDLAAHLRDYNLAQKFAPGHDDDDDDDDDDDEDEADDDDSDDDDDA
jgi:hypothetical protein